MSNLKKAQGATERAKPRLPYRKPTIRTTEAFETASAGCSQKTDSRAGGYTS